MRKFLLPVTYTLYITLPSMSDIISEAFDIRSDSDYNDYFVISKKEVEEQISNAQYFYDRVEEHVVAQIKDGG